MEKEILILSLSDKYSGYCVAGIDVKTFKFIRLVDDTKIDNNSIPKLKLYSNCGDKIKILNTIRATNLKEAPTLMHPENFSISTDTTFNILNNGDQEFVRDIFLNCPKFSDNKILGDQSNVIYDKVITDHSLEMVPFKNGVLYSVSNGCGKIKTKFDFTFNNVRYKRFSVTDPDKYLKKGELVRIDSGFAIISIPDDEWSRKNGFYKFIATIFNCDC